MKRQDNQRPLPLSQGTTARGFFSAYLTALFSVFRWYHGSTLAKLAFYRSGLALSNLLGFDESKFKLTTSVAGGIGTLLSAFGLLNAFQGFLSLMSALIPPLAGVLIASY